MATDGADVARTEPPPLPMRWLNAYTGTLGLLGVSLVVAPLLLRPGGSAAILEMVGLGGFLIAVSVGLAKRERWAWQVNYWGLPVALVGLGLTILSGLPLLRTPQELVTPLSLGLAVGLLEARHVGVPGQRQARAARRRGGRARTMIALPLAHPKAT